MSLILSIDTTAEFGSLALLGLRDSGEAIEAELPIHAPDGFGHILYDHLQALLKRNNVELRAITLFAAASGPGSFTGVRVGLAAAKGLAEVSAKQMVAVSNLRALASFGTKPRRATLLDARRGEVYAAIYGERLEIISDEVVAPLPQWLASSDLTGDIEFVAQDFTAFAGALPPAVPRTTAPRALAMAIARIAAQSEPEDPAAVDANYVRRSDAELFWTDAPPSRK
ncbi:MAG: tRNA (adenosine(37)-N6)-threonylcarbamoyltransferase complex dimerization subunit type 1 TsaB [Bryobacteraceae bacterium]